MNEALEKAMKELKNLEAQHANKVSKDLRDAIVRKKDEIINLIKGV